MSISITVVIGLHIPINNIPINITHHITLQLIQRLLWKLKLPDDDSNQIPQPDMQVVKKIHNGQ